MKKCIIIFVFVLGMLPRFADNGITLGGIAEALAQGAGDGDPTLHWDPKQNDGLQYYDWGEGEPEEEVPEEQDPPPNLWDPLEPPTFEGIDIDPPGFPDTLEPPDHGDNEDNPQGEHDEEDDRGDDGRGENEDPDDGSGYGEYDPNDEIDSPDSPGQQNEPSNPPGSQGPDKQPQEDDDCDEAAEQAAEKAQATLDAGRNEEKDKLDKLRELAQEEKDKGKIEYGVRIEKNSNGEYVMTDIITGERSSIDLSRNENTVYNIHTHPSGGGPSVSDVYNALYDARNYGNYQGDFIFASDGSVYLITVTDRDAVNALSDADFNSLTVVDGHFTDPATQDKYGDIYESLMVQGYSPATAQAHAMAAILDGKNTGLSISKKESGEKDFKPLSTDKDKNNMYKPKKCK